MAKPIPSLPRASLHHNSTRLMHRVGLAKPIPSLPRASLHHKSTRLMHRVGLVKPIPSLPRASLHHNSTRLMHRVGLAKPIPSLPRASLHHKSTRFFAALWDWLRPSHRCRGRPCTIKQKRCAQASLVHLFCFMVRKEWDSNPRYTKKRTPDFESGPFDHSGIFPLQK